MQWLNLRELSDQLPSDDPSLIEACLDFFEAETRGIGHGRARARIARRLKHCPLSDKQQRRVVKVVTRRLMSGQFCEQFKDQLRLALRINPRQLRETAELASQSSRNYVARHARWVLNHPNAGDESNHHRAHKGTEAPSKAK